MKFLRSKVKITCNFCSKQFVRKGLDHSESLPCPRCDSIARERVVYSALLAEYGELLSGPLVGSTAVNKLSVLEFSPRSSGRRLPYNQKAFQAYVSSDFDQSAHKADVVIDLTDPATLEGHLGGYDVVVFAHVLEHIPDYQTALQNLATLIKPDGIVLLQVPILEAAYTKITWDEFHGDNTRAYHRFGFDLADDLAKYFADVSLWVCKKEFAFDNDEVKPDKYRYLKDNPIKVQEFGAEAAQRFGLGCSELCECFVLRRTLS